MNHKNCFSGGATYGKVTQIFGVRWGKGPDGRRTDGADSWVCTAASWRNAVSAAVRHGGFADCRKVSGSQGTGRGRRYRFHYVYDHWLLHGRMQRFFHSDLAAFWRKGLCRHAQIPCACHLCQCCDGSCDDGCVQSPLQADSDGDEYSGRYL